MNQNDLIVNVDRIIFEPKKKKAEIHRISPTDIKITKDVSRIELDNTHIFSMHLNGEEANIIFMGKGVNCIVLPGPLGNTLTCKPIPEEMLWA